MVSKGTAKPSRLPVPNRKDLLVWCGVFRANFGSLLLGDWEHCLIGALATTLNPNRGSVGLNIGDAHIVALATAHVTESHQGKMLVKATTFFRKKGGIDLALLCRVTGRLVLSVGHLCDGKTR
jgi:hypothetical protein